MPADTLAPCPKCAGKGYVMIPTKRRNAAGNGLAYVREDCALCDTLGKVTGEVKRAWEAENPREPRRMP